MLQDAMVKPDAVSPPILRLAQAVPHFLREPSFYSEHDDLPQPHAAASSRAWRSASVGRTGGVRLRAATARAPSANNSSCRGSEFFIATFHRNH
jgi:hypothetical protein